MQLTYHHGVNEGRISLQRFVELTAEAPAKIFGMYPKKGICGTRFRADILIWDPEAKYTITAATQNMHTDYSIFEASRSRATPARYFSRGDLVVDDANSSAPSDAVGIASRGAEGMSLYVEGPTSLTDAYGPARRPHALQRGPRADDTGTAHLGTYNYIALWFSMSMEVTTYIARVQLIAGGRTGKKRSPPTVGQPDRAHPLILNAHAGTKYGIPFPVFRARPFWRPRRHVPALLRAIVACGWFGIQSWIGANPSAPW